MKVISTEREATDLAELLNRDDRSRPIVVVSTPSGRTRPWIDPEWIESELGALAEVYLVPTGPHSWTFSEKMPAGTQVYGGAGRAYPLGHEWVRHLEESPLRFAYDAAEGERATKQLIDDALGMAAAAGLFEAEEKIARVRRTGIVKGIVAEPALVDLDGQLAEVPPALAFHGVAIDRVLIKGMNVQGWWDPRSRWFDVRDSMRDPAQALSEYAAGDVVLAVVGELSPDKASLFLHPLLEITVDRSEVTSNELDDLRSLMSPAEVLAVRVIGAGPDRRLSLLDVDDGEEPRPAIALFEGGPPWLEPAVVDELAREPLAAPDIQARPTHGDDTLAVEESLIALEESLAAVAPIVDAAPVTERPSPSPLMLDTRRHVRRAVAPVEAPARAGSAALESMSLTISTLKAQLARLREEFEPMRSRLLGIELENAGLAAEVASLRRDKEHQDALLQQARSRLRKAVQRKLPRAEPPKFADPELGFRYAVLTAWAQRTPLAEQSTRPLPEYLLGLRFLESLTCLEGISLHKVADVVFEIVTDRAKDLPGRELHPRRTSDGGNSPQRIREDGAAAWRAALQQNTPSARRIHFWRLPDGTVELSRVVLHDDMNP